MKQHFWLSITMSVLLAALLAGCGAIGFEEEESTTPNEPINPAEWPTPVPTQARATPTPFPKIQAPPTATATVNPNVPIELPTPDSPAQETGESPAEAAAVDSSLSAIAQKVGPLAGLSPVAVGFISTDNTPIRQGPGASYGTTGSGTSAEMAAVLGRNSGGDWLYVITISAQQGWVPLSAMRVTGSLADAPVLPPNPIEAAVLRAASEAAGGNAETGTSTDGQAPQPGSPTQQTVTDDLEPVATARVASTALNMRQRPGAQYELLGTLAQGEELSVLALNRDQLWALVETADKRQGWVSVNFLEIDGSLADAPQVRTLGPDDEEQTAPIVTLSGQTAGGTPLAEPVSVSTQASSSQSAVPGSNPLAAVTTAKINSKVDLRRGPGQQFGAVDTLQVDEPVTILARDESGDWLVVQATRSRLGWLPLNTLDLEGSVSNAAPVNTAWVTSNEVTVRQGPGLDFPWAGKLAINDMVAVLASNPGRNWVLVQTVGGGQAWIQPRLLTDYSVSLEDLPQLESTPAVAQEPETPPQPAIDLSGRGPGKIVFQRSSGGDIMIINPDGTGLRQITTGIDPVLSPDGQTVAFTRWEGETGSVWLAGIDGSNERQILNFTKQAKGPTWSPDGSRIAINFQQGGYIQERSQCGSRPPRNAFDVGVKIEQNSDGEIEANLCWKLPPDPFWNLRVINVSDGAYEDMDGGTYAFRPTWDPANPWRVVSDGGRGLVELDVTRNYQQAITDNANDGSPVFSPDGRFIVVSAGHPSGGQGYDLYRLNADGSGRVRLTQTPLWETVQPEAQKAWNNVAPTWSPDGTQIAFLTDRTGRWEVWVMNIDGSDQRPLFSDEINNQLDLTYNFVDERMLSWR